MAETEQQTEQTELEQSEQATGDELAGLDDETRKLVERANAQAAARRREARAERDRAEKAERELANVRQSQESETERLVREAELRGYEKAAPLILEADMALAASGRMRNPEDAAKLLDDEARAELLATTDPRARRERALELVDELLEQRPYLVLDESTPANGVGLVRQGARSTETPGRVPEDADAWLRGLGK